MLDKRNYSTRHAIELATGTCSECGSVGDHCPNEPPAAPSSPDARARGCTCPDLFNGADGYGLDRRGTIGTWAIAGDCPIHARNLPEAQP